MAEELTDYLSSLSIRVRYLHSDIDALQRVDILRGLRLGEFDVLVGINLLREGLDLPEVSLVAVCDADKEGFLRSEKSLIQTAGRAARHVEGQVIFYADKVTDSMRRAIDETNRRRTLQLAYNEEHGITPRGIVKSLDEVRLSTSVVDARHTEGGDVLLDPGPGGDELIATLEAEMLREAKALNFEKAASLRDRIDEIRLQAVLEREERERGRTGRRRKGGR
jgi:excinuclease ABC subunit B